MYLGNSLLSLRLHFASGYVDNRLTLPLAWPDRNGFVMNKPFPVISLCFIWLGLEFVGAKLK